MDKKVGVKKTVILSALIFAVLISMLIVALATDTDKYSLFRTEDPVYISTDTLSKLVSKTIIENCNVNLQSCECLAEGHIILGTENLRDTLTVYTLTRYGAYAFENNCFVRMQSCDILPVVMTFTVDSDEQFELVSYKYPEDKALYTSDVTRLFPGEYRLSALSVSDENMASLENQELSYVKDYLLSIGRDANIVNSIEKSYFENLGATRAALNTIIERYPNNPIWNGTREITEGDVRYVYESTYMSEDEKIKVCKYPYGTSDYIYCELVDILSGKVSIPSVK